MLLNLSFVLLASEQRPSTHLLLLVHISTAGAFLLLRGAG